MVTPPPDHVGLALSFGKALLSRDYSRAFAMTSTDYQRRTTLEQMGARP